MSVAFRNNSTPSTPSALVSGGWAKARAVAVGRETNEQVFKSKSI